MSGGAGEGRTRARAAAAEGGWGGRPAGRVTRPRRRRPRRRDIREFTPQTENFFVSNIKLNKGIQCRFGMRGVIAEAHYDGGRNMVAMLKGAKRCARRRRRGLSLSRIAHARVARARGLARC